MLRYRSYSVDFLRKPAVMLEDHEIKSIDDLMSKHATDEEGRLTSELYKSAFARIQKGLEDENYFDVICLSQSIMNERVGKLLQTFQGIEDKFKLMTGLEETISNLLSFMDLQNIEIDPELNDLCSDISTGQKGNTWVDRRDTSLHEYVSVFSDNINFTTEMRDGFNRRTAEIGVQLAIKTITVIDRLME
jgi:hypothetical protein